MTFEVLLEHPHPWAFLSTSSLLMKLFSTLSFYSTHFLTRNVFSSSSTHVTSLHSQALFLLSIPFHLCFINCQQGATSTSFFHKKQKPSYEPHGICSTFIYCGCWCAHSKQKFPGWEGFKQMEQTCIFFCDALVKTDTICMKIKELKTSVMLRKWKQTGNHFNI